MLTTLYHGLLQVLLSSGHHSLPYLGAGTVMLIAEISYGYASAKFLDKYTGTGTENKYGVKLSPIMDSITPMVSERMNGLVEQQPASITNIDVGNPYFYRRWYYRFTFTTEATIMNTWEITKLMNAESKRVFRAVTTGPSDAVKFGEKSESDKPK